MPPTHRERERVARELRPVHREPKHGRPQVRLVPQLPPGGPAAAAHASAQELRRPQEARGVPEGVPGPRCRAEVDGVEGEERGEAGFACEAKDV